MDYPKVRNLDVFPVVMQGKQYIGLRDPLGVMDGMLLLPHRTAWLMSLMDGQHSIRDIQMAFMQRFGTLLMSDEVADLVQQLDEHYLLDNERFRTKLAEVAQAFREQPIRYATHAGSAYPDDAQQLRALLNAFYEAPSGPGHPRMVATDSPTRGMQHADLLPCGMMVPHIDLQRGGPCYAWAYKSLIEAIDDVDDSITFVILGIAHQGAQQPFTVTDKDFETPLGIASANKNFVMQLIERCPTDLLADELVHRGEHSVEFQVLFLQHALDGKCKFTIVPILCTNFDDRVPPAETPMAVESIGGFIEALQCTIAEWHEPVCIISSVDLSHVGQRFGDALSISSDLLRWLQRYDADFLSYAEHGDAEGLFKFIRERRNRTHIDAHPALYVMLKVLPEVRGRLLKYDQAVDVMAQSVVSFAAMVFEKRGG